jgi:hypothetical protein
MTPIDAVHAAMDAAPEDEAARLAFYERLAESELFLLLDRPADADAVVPRLLELSTGALVAVFDTEDRLAAFAGAGADYAALPGRRLAGMLAGQGIGIGLNLGVASSAIVLPPKAVDWLAGTLGQGPAEVDARIETLTVPKGVPEALLAALDRKLARAAGLAASAWLSGVTYADGRRGHLLAIIDAEDGAEAALAAEIAEALTFAGLDAGELDVVFLAADDPVTDRLSRVGLRFDLPEAPTATGVSPAAAGMDPDRPPKLR